MAAENVSPSPGPSPDGKGKRNGIIAVVIAVAAVVGGIAAFTDALTKIGKFVGLITRGPLTAHVVSEKVVAANGKETGAVRVKIRFANPPEMFSVKTVVLRMTEMKEIPIGSHPSAKIEPVTVTVAIPEDAATNDKLDLPVDVDLNRVKDEAYAYAVLVLGFDNRGKRLAFRAQFSYLDVAGKPIQLKTEPESLELSVSNYSNISYEPKPDPSKKN